jgi:hypothetical protein
MRALGVSALYQFVPDPCVKPRGSKRALPSWQGRILYGLIAATAIVGGLAVWLGPFSLR